MLIELREHLDRDKIAPWPERALFGAARRLMESPALFHASARIGRWLQRPFVSAGRVRRLPWLGGWTATRDLPAVASRTFTERWKDLR
jgi:Uncharacterized conserved protein containing a ferredoxin-like domain